MRIRAAVVAVMTVISLGIGAAPAYATSAQGYIGGTGDILDDWDDEGTISRTTNSYGNVVGLWQYILWADGATKKDGTRFSLDDIDCQFGPTTEYATMKWQSMKGFTGADVDGFVGPKSWKKAGDSLVKTYGTDAFATYTGRIPGQWIDLNRDGGKHYLMLTDAWPALTYRGTVTVC